MGTSTIDDLLPKERAEYQKQLKAVSVSRQRVEKAVETWNMPVALTGLATYLHITGVGFAEIAGAVLIGLAPKLLPLTFRFVRPLPPKPSS